MKKILIILTIFLTSCGYQPIYLNKNLKNFEFSQIISEGEKNINRQVINFINLKENSQNTNLNELFINSSYEVKETSRNLKGQVDTYRSTITIDLSIKKNDKIVKNKTFVKTFSYNNKENKLELVDYQKNIKQILVNKISEDVIFFLNL